MGTSVYLLLLASAGAAACLLVFVSKDRRNRSLEYYFAFGVALQFLLSLPAGFYQAFGGIELIRNKPAALRLAVPFIAAPYNMGGWTVRQAFEGATDPLPPDAKGRVKPVAMARFPVFLAFAALQVGALSFLFARRYRLVQTVRDPHVLAGGAFVLLNSLLNAPWSWWR